MRITCAGTVLVAAAAFFASSAIAQQAPTPGQVEQSLKPPPQLNLPASPEIQPERRPPPPTTAGKTVTVRKFEFSGNTVYDAPTLGALIVSYLDRPVSLTEIYAAADVITDYYVKHGYSLASVSVPPQKVTDGVVRFEISEGRVNFVFIEGNRSYKSNHLERVLGDIKSGELYRGDSLHDGLHRLNELPGLTAKAVVKPGDVEGTSDIVIHADEQRVGGGVSIDNYGRKDIGEWRYSAFGQLNNPLGLDDQLQVLGLRSQSGLLTYYNAGYSAAVNANQTRLGLSYGHATFGVKALPVGGKFDAGEVTLTQTLFDTWRNKATVFVGASRTDANTDLSGLAISSTLITLFELGGSYNHVYGNQAVTQVAANIHTNFQRLDAAAFNAGLPVKDNELLRLEVDAQHLQPLFERFGLLAHVDAVYSPDVLVDTEKFNLGGPQSVRAYQASQVRGDRGYLASLNLVRPFEIGPVGFVGRVFTDVGQAWNIGPGGKATLSGAGLGFDARYRFLSAKVDWSFPLNENFPSSNFVDYSFLFASITASF